jgi:uncharacterized membrane protein YhaH (DUF805 family)
MKTYFSFSGRMSRREFWVKFAVWYIAASLGLHILSLSDPELAGWLSLGFFVLSLWPWLAVNTKRLHDRGHSIWYGLFMLAVALTLGGLSTTGIQGAYWMKLAAYLVAAIVAIDVQFISGKIGPNRYGPDPVAGAYWDGSPRLYAPTDMRHRSRAGKSDIPRQG